MASQLLRLAAYGVCLDDDRMLLARYASPDETQRHWTLPGGRVEHVEDPFDAVVREVAEETGYVVEVEQLLGVDSRSRYVDFGGPGGTELHSVGSSIGWTPTMRAYLGTTVPGFPNLFLLLGPNTGLGHTSVVLMIEAQLRQLVRALRHLRRTGAATIEPTPAAQRRHTARVDAKMAGTVWTTGCASWYLDATGRNSTLWPGYATGFRLRLARFRPADYLVVPDAG